MKKAFKITGITLGCLVGLVLIAAVIALATVTSPKRLTKMVKKYVPGIVNFDMDLQQAQLTLVKTFPDVGLELDKAYVLSPMEGAPTDTLALVDKLIVSLNAKKLLKERAIVVNRCILNDAVVTLFTDAEGHSNLDIFSSDNTDTVSQPFDYSLDLQQVELNNATLVYDNRSQGMRAGAEGLDLAVRGSLKEALVQADVALKTKHLTLAMDGLQGASGNLSLDFDGTVNDFNTVDGTLQLVSDDLSLTAGSPLLSHDRVSLDVPINLNLKPLKGNLGNTVIALNDYLIQLKGDAAMDDQGDLALNIDFNTNALDIEDVMRRLPEGVVKSLGGIQFKGRIQLNDGRVDGIFNDSLMPLITANVEAKEATVAIPQLPYPFTQVDLNTQLHLDLNDSINADDVKLSAMMNRSKINVTGNVDDLTDQMAFDVRLRSDLILADLKRFLPDGLDLGGRSQVALTLKSTLNDLLAAITKAQFSPRLKADATLAINDFSFAMDSIQALTPTLGLELTLPASRREKGRSGVYIGLNSPNIDATMGTNMQAAMNDFHLTASADQLAGGLKTLLAEADIQLSKLDVVLDTIRVAASQPAITLATLPKKQQGLGLQASFKSHNIDAAAGTSYALKTHALKVTGSASENPSKNDFLNHWNPTADFTLTQAEVQLAGIDETIVIPTIDFLFNPNELGFKRGTVKIGKSDATLEGNVVGISQWIEDHRHLMKADLQLTSNYLDINEIMDITSGLGVKDETAEVDTTAKEDHPFMVPEGIDFNFIIKANKALYGNFDLNNLGGTATVKDGTLLLREIGFTNQAAEMQLTAMYQSPRKNHLFLGLDFHLLNVQIYDLLHMIPEIDTIVPMLKTFDGAAEFHIAAQTNLKSNYELKMSTLRASADIEGANLRVKDVVSFTRITDMLKVSTNGEYKIDSLDIQMTAFRDEVDLWPFQIAIGKYKATVDGHYNLNTIGEYHISVTDSPLPTRLGLKISGPLNDLSYSLESCKYPHLYRPERRNDTEQMVMELKRMIASKLKENVM